jgi:hypothetical protein
LEGRKDDKTMPRRSTFNRNSKHPFKVKPKLDSKSFWFPPTRLLFGLYDYRFKHIAVMKEEDYNRNIASTPSGLAQLLVLDDLESRTTLFQGEEDDMTTPSPIQDAPSTTRTSPTTTLDHVFDGPFTHSRTKKLQHKVNALLCEIHYNNTENYILPKLCMFYCSGSLRRMTRTH